MRALSNTRFDAAVSGAAPGAGTDLATLTNFEEGLYQLDIVTFQTGTVDTNGANARLVIEGSVVPGDLLTTAVGSRILLWRYLRAGDDVTIETGAAAGGAGAIYCAQLAATKVA